MAHRRWHRRLRTGPGLDDIWIMAAGGSNQRNLTNQPLWEDTKPTWLPDGQWIAFFRWSPTNDPNEEGGPSGLWTIKPDGSEEILISDEATLGGLLAQ